MPPKEDEDTKASVVFLEKDCKVPDFSGASSYENWERDAKKAVRGIKETRQLSLVLRALRGSAKDEADLREDTIGDFENITEVFTHLKSVFGDKRSATKRQADFHSRCQLTGESVAQFSQDLVRLSKGIEGDKNILLTAQFIENVRDPGLRWELKKAKELDTVAKLKFQQYRELALSWEETNSPSTSSRKDRRAAHDGQQASAPPDATDNRLDAIENRLGALENRPLTCAWCGFPGHTMARCFRFQNDAPFIFGGHGQDGAGRGNGSGNGQSYRRRGRSRGRGRGPPLDPNAQEFQPPTSSMPGGQPPQNADPQPSGNGQPPRRT